MFELFNFFSGVATSRDSNGFLLCNLPRGCLLPQNATYVIRFVPLVVRSKGPASPHKNDRTRPPVAATVKNETEKRQKKNRHVPCLSSSRSERHVLQCHCQQAPTQAIYIYKCIEIIWELLSLKAVWDGHHNRGGRGRQGAPITSSSAAHNICSKRVSF